MLPVSRLGAEFACPFDSGWKEKVNCSEPVRQPGNDRYWESIPCKWREERAFRDLKTLGKASSHKWGLRDWGGLAGVEKRKEFLGSPQLPLHWEVDVLSL